MRTIIYNKMLFQQRRMIHKQYKEHFRVTPLPAYLFFGMDFHIRNILTENILTYHFTHCLQDKADNKRNTNVSRTQR